MADCFNILSTSAGQATTSAGAATVIPTSPGSTTLRIVCDGYLRIEFGGNSVVASVSSALFAPGEVYIRQPSGGVYYSVMATTGTVNYSLSIGQPVMGYAP